MQNHVKGDLWGVHEIQNQASMEDNMFVYLNSPMLGGYKFFLIYSSSLVSAYLLSIGFGYYYS